MSEPLVSVLVASFNHERFIEQALDSIAVQSHRNFELIIVDDCSTDGSVELIRRWTDRTGLPTVLVVNEWNRGICAVLNQLFALASGEFCILLDTDDWMEPDRIRAHINHFEELDPDIPVVFGDAAMRDEEGRSVGVTFLHSYLRGTPIPDGTAVFDQLLAGNFIPTSAVTVRRSAIVDAGGYDESLSYDDYDMWLRLSHRSRFSYCEGIVSNYRVVSTSMSHSPAWKSSMTRSTITILERWAAVADVREVPFRRVRLADYLRREARVIASSDPRCAQSAMRLAEDLLPSARWRMIDRLRLFHLPGGPALVEYLLRRKRSRRPSNSESES